MKRQGPAVLWDLLCSANIDGHNDSLVQRRHNYHPKLSQIANVTTVIIRSKNVADDYVFKYNFLTRK